MIRFNQGDEIAQKIKLFKIQPNGGASKTPTNPLQKPISNFKNTQQNQAWQDLLAMAAGFI